MKGFWEQMKTFQGADILIPQGIDLTKWSVVACDQYTSEPEYWQQVEAFVGDAPSTLHITFPEAYLSEGEQRIRAINAHMEAYLEQGLFAQYSGMVYVERTLRDGRIRKGLVGAVDLEDYSFATGARPMVRATEGTVLERIPPRVKIRERAKLELPHVMLLIDDPDKAVIEGVRTDGLQKLYDFDLMMDSGHLAGYLLGEAEQARIERGLAHLADKAEYSKKYGVEEAFVFAVGDGNHSLAAAKTCWEQTKKTLSAEEQQGHPARFALVELVNLHDDSLVFEAIHRVVSGVEPARLLEQLQAFCCDAARTEGEDQRFICVNDGARTELCIRHAPCGLTVGSLQQFLDAYIKTYGGSVDYIHGVEVTERLAAAPDAVGFLLPAIEKRQFFKTILLDGALPRKTFSMGEAHEKRFYMEAKKITY